MKYTRNFYPGGRWIYFRIYTGVKTADKILISLTPLLKKLLKNNIIIEYFFIRYSDPDFHIRLRLLLTDVDNIGHVMILFNKKINTYCNNRLISKVEIGTYQREIERYNNKYIKLSEKIFFIDSECILSLLSYFQEKNENLRWMSAIMLIDFFFDDVKLNLQERSLIMKQLSDSFKMEFGFNMYNAKQLNEIYRERKKQVEIVLDNDKISTSIDLDKISRILKSKSKSLKKILVKKADVPKGNILVYIHMSMNRIFRSKNRVHELLIYDILSRYYKSELAKLKYCK